MPERQRRADRAAQRGPRRSSALLIALHVAAGYLRPLAFACNAADRLADCRAALRSFFSRIARRCVLTHGYAFFAPNPGPNHLVDYTVEFDDGRPAEKGRFPNLRDRAAAAVVSPLFHAVRSAAQSTLRRRNSHREPSPPPLTATAGERERYAAIKKDYDGAKRAVAAGAASSTRRCGLDREPFKK